MGYKYPDKIRRDILEMIPRDGIEIASYGCGTGATEHVLAKAGRRVHGLDISVEALEIARTRLTSIKHVSAGVYDYFKPSSLDGLILADVLEHLPQAHRALQQMASWIRPGGWAVISVPNMRNYRTLWTFMIKGDWPEESTGLFDDTHIQVMTQKRLARWCSAAGLGTLTWRRCYPPTPRWRRHVFSLVDAMTLRAGSEWYQYQLQVLTRRHAGPMRHDAGLI